MKITYFSSTDLKRKTAKILNLVAYGEMEAIIERYGESIAKITPISPIKKSKNEIREKLEKYFGAIPSFPAVSKSRVFRKRKFSL